MQLLMKILAVTLILTAVLIGFQLFLLPGAFKQNIPYFVRYIEYNTVFVISISSTGLSDANAVRFVMDQLVEASSTRLNSVQSNPLNSVHLTHGKEHIYSRSDLIPIIFGGIVLLIAMICVLLS